MKKVVIKNLAIVVAIVAVIALLISGIKIQSVDDYYLTHLDEIKPDSETVYMRIACDTILDNYSMLDDELKNEKYVPSDGKILLQTEYVLRPKDTTFDLLSRVTRANKIQMISSGGSKFGSNYIQSINHLYERSCGALSGWMFKVNGEFPPYGSSKYKLKDGDIIEWLYTCDLGRDIGGENIDQT